MRKTKQGWWLLYEEEDWTIIKDSKKTYWIGHTIHDENDRYSHETYRYWKLGQCWHCASQIPEKVLVLYRFLTLL